MDQNWIKKIILVLCEKSLNHSNKRKSLFTQTHDILASTWGRVGLGTVLFFLSGFRMCTGRWGFNRHFKGRKTLLAAWMWSVFKFNTAMLDYYIYMTSWKALLYYIIFILWKNYDGASHITKIELILNLLLLITVQKNCVISLLANISLALTKTVWSEWHRQLS